MDKVDSLTLSEKLIAGGGLLMLIASFLPWYEGTSGIFLENDSNGWESPAAIWSILATLIAVAMAGAVLALKFGNVRLPDLSNITLGQIFLVAGGIVAVCIFLKLIDYASSVSFGFLLGIIAAIACAAGGYLMYAEEKAGIIRH